MSPMKSFTRSCQSWTLGVQSNDMLGGMGMGRVIEVSVNNDK